MASILPLTLFSLLLSISSAIAGQNPPLSPAQKLIRSFNLFPKESLNFVKVNESTLLPPIVEKSFSLSVLGESGATVEGLGHRAGYYRLPNSYAARMFYLFFESRSNKDDPVVIWLTGGPGCGSELALFNENGPFKITKNLSLIWNDYGWDMASNIIFVDQPTGTGFSYTSDERDIRTDEPGVSNDLYDFLQAFFKEHPQFVNNDFYITGESYAGHYIPAFATRVNQGNKEKQGIHINLKGFAIGNGLTNPEIQYAAYPEYAKSMKLLTESEYESVKKLVPDCHEAIQPCSINGTECLNALSVCNTIFDSIMGYISGTNYYDIRKECEGQLCYDFSIMETFLSEDYVKDALGVGNIEYVSCSSDVYYAMQGDWMRNLEVGIPALLEDGIHALIYAGEYDLICNWLGNSQWVHAMAWSGQKDFAASPISTYVVDGVKSGELQSHGPLSFLKIYNAGHMVPMDQPKAALQMLKSWTQGMLK